MRLDRSNAWNRADWLLGGAEVVNMRPLPILSKGG